MNAPWRLAAPDAGEIITTDDVLCEYLAVFADARSNVRFEAGEIVAELIDDPDMRVVAHSGETLMEVCGFTAPVQTKATVWSIAFRCRLCAGKV